MIFIYASPVKIETGKPLYLANAYVYPYFYQNWNLFVPVPESNYQLFVKEAKDKNYKDVFSEVLTKHQSNRLLGYEPLVIGFSNCIHYFEKNSELQNTLYGPISADANFDILMHATKSYLQHKQNKKVDSLQLILVVSDVEDGKQRMYYN
jgi:hypothetical protein